MLSSTGERIDLRLDTPAVIPAKAGIQKGLGYIAVCAGTGKKAVDVIIHSEQRPPSSFDKLRTDSTLPLQGEGFIG